MNQNFHESKKISIETLGDLVKKSNYPASVHFIVMYFLILLSWYMIIFTWDKAWYWILISHIFFGITCCSSFACLHETVHNTAFKSIIMNKIAAFLVAIPHLYASTMFREFHFTHHRYTHIPGKDPEISLGGKPIISIIQSFPLYFGWISGLPLFLFKSGMLINSALGMPEFLRKKVYTFVDPKVRFKLWLESTFIVCIYAIIIYVAVYINASFWAIFTGQISGHCILAMYTAAEHNGLPHEGDIFERTRHMNTNKIIRLIMWNMPYHAEHHAYPSVPYHKLPKVHELIDDEIHHKDKSYSKFHIELLKKYFFGR